MPVENLTYYPASILTDIAKEVTDFTATSFFDLLENLEDSLLHYGGVGLAAPQINTSLRVFVLDLSKLKTNYVDDAEFEAIQDAPIREFINPEIIAREGAQKNDEGCLSMPGFVVSVPRSLYVKVRAQDASGEVFEYEATGYEAAAIQHEIDHLDGVMHITRTSGTRRHMAMKKYRRFMAARKRMSKLGMV